MLMRREETGLVAVVVHDVYPSSRPDAGAEECKGGCGSKSQSIGAFWSLNPRLVNPLRPQSREDDRGQAAEFLRRAPPGLRRWSRLIGR
jgi:hypothetical protein